MGFAFLVRGCFSCEGASPPAFATAKSSARAPGRALCEVVAGRSVGDSGVVERLVDYRSRQSESPMRLLSEREIDVLREIAEGNANASIAGSLHLSEWSVEKYVNSIFSKLGPSEEKLLSRRVASVLAISVHPRHQSVLSRPDFTKSVSC